MNLSKSITSAIKLLIGSAEGVAGGNYKRGARSALITAITNAQAVYASKTVSQTDIDQANTDLNNAVNVFKSQIIVEIDPVNLVAQYTFDAIPVSSLGVIVTDNSGNGHNGEVNKGALYWGGAVPTTILDRYGVDSRALHYNRGANIQIPYSTAINPAAMTISCWFNIDVSSPLRDNQYLISLNRDAGFQLVYRSNQSVGMALSLAETPGTKVIGDAGVTITPGTWYHLVVTFGDGHLRFYVNGTQTRDIIQAGTFIKNGAVGLCFGQDIPTDSYGLTPSDPNFVGDGGFLSGALDEVRIYKTVLSPTQISAIYTLEKP
ncbi:MAG TPA: hypothetical protein PLX35_04860 [Cyclobacteriaceae bacterium]|nr:hypothetical protein [Cyclobacteriaceae bacterium]